MCFKTKSLIALLIVSIFLISGCEVYQTLYGAAPAVPQEQAAAPSENISMEKEEVAAEKEVETKEEEEAAVEKAEVKEITEEKPQEAPVVILLQETDMVSLSPEAEDPDRDTSLVFTFTSPLDENGEWQTTYGDAGEYTVTVTASDGESTTTKEVLIIINKKEETPIIDSAKPIESGLSIDETQSVEFSVGASDLNKDPLSYLWKLDGIDVGNEDEYTYQSTYEDAGTHTVKIDVSDGLSSASKIWSVNVENVNRKPVLEKIENIRVRETDSVAVTLLATDDDKDAVAYSISDKRFMQEDNVFTWQTDYDSAGTYSITVSASDGQDTTEQEFEIAVENVNRPPVILDIVQKK